MFSLLGSERGALHTKQKVCLGFLTALYTLLKMLLAIDCSGYVFYNCMNMCNPIEVGYAPLYILIYCSYHISNISGPDLSHKAQGPALKAHSPYMPLKSH